MSNNMFGSNLFRAMQGPTVSLPERRIMYKHRSFRTLTFVNPFKKVPDVGAFEIELGKRDPIMEKHGVRRRFKPLLHFIPYSNKSLNRYIEHQVKRLNATKNRSKIF